MIYTLLFCLANGQCYQADVGTMKACQALLAKVLEYPDVVSAVCGIVV